MQNVIALPGELKQVQVGRYSYLTWLACESLRDLFPAGATDVLPSVRHSYPPQLPAAATRFPSHGSGRPGLELQTATKLSSAGFEPRPF